MAENGEKSPCLRSQMKHHEPIVFALDRAAYNQGEHAQYNIGVDDTGGAFTVIAKGPDAVYYAVDVRNNRIQEVNGTLQAKPNGGISNNQNNVVLILRPVDIILRRLTPTECARLQGMPDWWCDDIDVQNPTEEDMTFWREVFETYRLATTPDKKPKTDNQFRKFLKNPYSDGAQYKMWGNGMALPCVMYVMEGIAKALSDNDD